jgi:hypothetical protein
MMPTPVRLPRTCNIGLLSFCSFDGPPPILCFVHAYFFFFSFRLSILFIPGPCVHNLTCFLLFFVTCTKPKGEFFRERAESRASTNGVVDVQPLELDSNANPNPFRHHYCASFAAMAFQRMGLLSMLDDPGNFFPPEFSTTGTPRPYCCCAWCCQCAAGGDITDQSGTLLFGPEVEIEWPLWGHRWERDPQQKTFGAPTPGPTAGRQPHRRIDRELGKRYGTYYAAHQVKSGEDKCEAVLKVTFEKSGLQ